MMTHDRRAGQVAILALAIACGACGKPPAPTGTPHWSGRGPDGSLVVVRAVPERIVAGSAAAAEILLALVPPDRVAAIPEQAFSGYARGCGAREEWHDRTFDRYHGEALLIFEPDLVISHTWQDPAANRVLRGRGIPVLCLDPIHRFAHLTGALTLLADVCNVAPKGRELVEELERRRAVLARDDSRRRLRAVSYTNFGTGGWPQGGASTANLLISLAGMQNAAAEGGRKSHYQLGVEELVALDPDLLIVGVDDEGESPGRDFLRSAPALQDLHAIRDGRFVELPTALWATTSHHLLDAAELLAKRVDELMGR